MIKNVGIIGIGGVGGYFGGKICQVQQLTKDLKVYFIARGQHLIEIQKNGLTLNTITEGTFTCIPTLVTDDIRELPVLDLCIISVKVFDLNDVVKELVKKMKPDTIIIPLLNGVDIYTRIRNVISTGIILPATVYMGAQIERPGVVTQKAGACKILLGQGSDNKCKNLEELFLLFDNAKIKYQWFDDVNPEIWEKFIFIASFGLVTACYKRTIGEVLETKELSEAVRNIMNEIYNLSQRLGIKLPKNIVEISFNKGTNFPYETKTSLQRDVEYENKPDERDLFSGTIIKLCNSNGLECHETLKIHKLINELKKLDLN